MDHFTHVIIRKSSLPSRTSQCLKSFYPGEELRAVTAAPAPDPAVWAFSDINDCVFAPHSRQPGNNDNRAPPREWMRRGFSSMQGALAVAQTVPLGDEHTDFS